MFLRFWMNLLIHLSYLCLISLSMTLMLRLCLCLSSVFCWFVYGWTPQASDSTEIAHVPTVWLESSNMRACSSLGASVWGASDWETHILGPIISNLFQFSFFFLNGDPQKKTYSFSFLFSFWLPNVIIYLIYFSLFSNLTMLPGIVLKEVTKPTSLFCDATLSSSPLYPVIVMLMFK